MDHNDREQFWKTLCSLPGNDIVAEREQLFKSIKYPKLLFHFQMLHLRHHFPVLKDCPQMLPFHINHLLSVLLFFCELL